MNVITGDFGRKACTNLASDLRAMADAVDRGEIIDLVAAFVEKGEYQMVYSTSLETSVFLATLLHRRAVDNCMAG